MNFRSIFLSVFLLASFATTSLGQNTAEVEKRVQNILNWNRSTVPIDPRTTKDSLDIAMELSRKNKLQKLETEILRDYIKFIINRTGDFDAATEKLQRIMTIAKESKNPEIESIYHFSKGRLLMMHSADRERGKIEFRKAIEILEKNKLKPNFDFLNNYAITEMEDGKLEHSLELFDMAEKAYHQSTESKDKGFLTTLNMNKGVAYLLMENYSKADYYLQEAIKASEESAELDDNFSAILYYGIFLQEQNKNTDALIYLNKAEKIQDQVNVDLAEKVLLFQGLSELHKQMQDFKKALQYRTMEITIRDSIKQRGISEKAFALEYKNQILSLRHEKKIADLNSKLEREASRSTLILSLSCLGLIVVISLFIAYRLNKRRQLSQILAKTERLEKERIKQEAELELFRKEEKLIKANVKLSASQNEMQSLKVRINNHLDQSHDPEFDELKRFVKQISSSEKRTEQLEYIDHVLNDSNNDFYRKLKNSHPNLTSDELRLATLIRSNLSSKELELVFNISNKSLMTKRYRMRKKIALQKTDSLEDYLKTL